MMTTATLSRDGLIAGEAFAPVPYTVAASQTIVRGRLLSYADGKVSACAAAGTAFGIAADDLTTGASDTTRSVPVYTVGVFNKNAVVFADGITDEQKTAALLAMRNIGLVTTNIVEA